MPRLLIVDDNESIHQDFKKVLEVGHTNKLRNVEMELFGAEDPEPSLDLPPINYQIDDAYQGDEAIDLVDRAALDDNPYAVVFMDVRMPPGMDGIKAAAEIWKRHPDTEMVICSAHSDYSWNDMLKEIGISDKLQFLRKPFDMVTVQQLALSCSKKWELEQATKKYIKQLEVENRLKEDAQARLARLNEDLESRIQSRTGELEKTNASLKEALNHLESAQEQLVVVEKMASLGGLVTGVANEINNPIDEGISQADNLRRETRTLLNLIESGDIEWSRVIEYLQGTEKTSTDLISSLNRAAKLVQSFTKVASDQSDDQIRKFKALEYLREIILPLEPKLKKNKIKVDIQGDETIELESYPGVFGQIIGVFVMNSLIHAFDPEKSGHLFIRLMAQGDTFILTFADDGKGIAPEHCKQIFDPLFTTQREKGGSGMGLHVVYNIVTQTLKGHITCNSKLGRGSMFTIKAPLKTME